MHLLALWDFFTDWNDRFPYPFIHLKPEKCTPFGAEPPRKGHYREYPPPLSGSSQVQRIPARVKAEHWSCQLMLSNKLLTQNLYCAFFPTYFLFIGAAETSNADDATLLVLRHARRALSPTNVYRGRNEKRERESIRVFPIDASHAGLKKRGLFG